MQAPASWLRLARAVAIAAACLAATASSAWAQLGESIPSRAYYVGVQELYNGEFRDAQRTFNRALTGGVKTLYQGGVIRWIDSICYHAMLGEVYYHWGQPDKALEQFDYACNLYLQYPRWMLRVQFDVQPAPDPQLQRTAIPWGAVARRSTPGKFQSAYPVAQGQIDQSRVVREGGVVVQPQLWPVNVVEIVRCTALAIRRRNELLGPLGPHNRISKNLVVNLSRGGAPPNHWSSAWVDVQRGLAHAGVGEFEQAQQFLERGALVAGQLDHPLTCIALLEQGKLALDAGNTAAAANLLAEASYSAYLYEDATVIDDAFRWGEINRIAAGAAEINPALQPAAAWARRERLDFIAGRINLALADELMTAGDWRDAAAALSAGGSQLGDARNGVLGNWAMYLDAKLQYQQGRESAAATLEGAIEGQRKISLQNFQIDLANRMFDEQTLPARAAPPVYQALLADPSPADTALQPLETMGVMTTPHDKAFGRWLLALLERKSLAAAMEVTDRAKRRRFHNALPWGGRLAALRDVLVAPRAALEPQLRQQQNDILTRFPEFAAVAGGAEKLRTQLDAAWRPPLEDEAQRKAAKLWEDYTRAVAERELRLTHIGLARVPAESSFPPFLPALELQKRLQPGQALLVYHDTPEGLLGLLVTAKASTHWNCGPSNRLAALVSQFLRDLGNNDANHELVTQELVSAKWHATSARLFKALFEGSSISPSSTTELIVVPDGVTWYVPFEALVADVDGKPATLVSTSKVRYAPTAGLAFSFEGTWRRVQRTGVVAGKLVPGDNDAVRAEVAAPLQAALPGALPLASPLPAPSPVVASLLDALVVLDDIEMPADPLDLTPLPLDRSRPQGSLEQWLALPASGPQRIVLPGMHTPAERGGKAARSRRGGTSAAPGDELFYASCSLMSAGAETLLLSRWRVGGQSTLDLVREFVQELPHTAAADAWQRSVQLAMEMPVDPLSELRVKAGKDAVELTAAHPFFWAGYLVVDSGWRPEEPELQEGQVAEPVAAPAVPPVPGAADAGKAPPPAEAAAAPAAVVPGQPLAAEPEKPGGSLPRVPTPPGEKK